MSVGHNLLHVILLVCSIACVALTWREVRREPLRRERLVIPVLLAVVCALMLLLLKVGTGYLPWTFFAALAAGLAAGGLRGFTLTLQVDHTFSTLRLAPFRSSLLVAFALVGAVLIEIGGVFAGTAGTPWRLAAPDIAALCAGMLTGRWMAIRIRWRSEPQVDLPHM